MDPRLAAAPMLRATMQQAIPTVNLPQPGPHGHHRTPLLSPKGDHPSLGVDGPSAGGTTGIPATPGRSGTSSTFNGSVASTGGPSMSARSTSGPLLAGGPGASSNCRPGPAPQERLPSPDTARLPSSRMDASSQSTTSLRRSGTGTHSSALLAPAPATIAASTPVLRGRASSSASGISAAPSLAGSAVTSLPGSGGGGAAAPSATGSADAKAAPRAASPVPGIVSKSSLLAGSSLTYLLEKVNKSIQERDQEMRRQQAEKRELEELLIRSKEEFHQLVGVVSQLHELQQSASEVQGVLPVMLGPERPRLQGKPPFSWQPSQEYADEFEVTGDFGEVVTKTRDFEDQGWVIPVGGSWRLTRGGLYRWTVKIEKKCPSRPQLQLGIHGVNHSQPWRLVTTSRCSWSRDDEPWQDRPGGDRLIEEGDYAHIEVDLRGKEYRAGTFQIAINAEPPELIFEDIPLDRQYPLIPVVSMGGDQSRVRLCPNY